MCLMTAPRTDAYDGVVKSILWSKSLLLCRWVTGDNIRLMATHGAEGNNDISLFGWATLGAVQEMV
jgi:hypothetical protein